MAPSPRTVAVAAYVGDGIDIHIRTLSPSEYANALKLGGDDEGIERALRMALFRIAGNQVTYNDLRGEQLDQHLPQARHFTQAMTVFGKLHDSDARPHLVEQALASLEKTGPGEWVVMLPEHRQGKADPPRRVEVRVVDRGTVRDAVQEAQRSARSDKARMFLAICNQVRRYVVAVGEGEGQVRFPAGMTTADLDEHFSVFDVLVLASVWKQLHAGSDEDDDLGNLQPVALPSS